MGNFTISPSLNKSRVFILQKSELEKRFDPFFYLPELLELERKVLAKKPKRLRDFVQSIASGATPKRDEEEKYYSAKVNGIPFLRVQNLSPTGILEFEDCKYINKETHIGMLKRSQVSAGDLLVKITGVGRMAIASVAPKGFEGNINQHVCVIKTGSKEISETLAAFLNSDIGERLASRRTTGGTRPALDYPALLSIPIIEDKRILQITAKVIEQKQKLEAEAEKLLQSIDNYLLNELGIIMPEPPENILKNRMFYKNMSELSGGKWDVSYYTSQYKAYNDALINSGNPTKILRQVTKIDWGNTNLTKAIYVDEGFPAYSASGRDGFLPFFEHEENAIILSAIGARCGKCFLAYNEKWTAIKNTITIIPKVKLDIRFLYAILDNEKLWEKSGGAQPFITMESAFFKLIPFPDYEKQKEISDYITLIRKQAQELKDKSKEALNEASLEIENILIGN